MNMNTYITTESELSFLSIGDKILGYNPVPNKTTKIVSAKILMKYIDETLQKEIIPSVIIHYKGKDRSINCFISSIRETHFAKYYFMEDVLNKKSHGLLVMAIPKKPDSISPPCLVNKSNSEIIFKPYSEKELRQTDKLLKELGFS